jgi:hypothetical protein
MKDRIATNLGGLGHDGGTLPARARSKTSLKFSRIAAPKPL